MNGIVTNMNVNGMKLRVELLEMRNLIEFDIADSELALAIGVIDACNPC